MHIEKEQHVLGTHREYHRLGEQVYRWVKENTAAHDVPLNQAMKDSIQRIRAAEKAIAQRKERLNHMTVVEVAEQPKVAVTKKRAAAGAKKAVPRRTKRKKPATKKA